MRNVLRWMLVVGVIVTVVGGFIWFRRQQAAETPLEVLRSAEVARGMLQISVSASGNIAVQEKTELMVETPGEITEVAVRVGERVREGQTLALIRTDDLARSLQQAEISLQLAELSLETAKEPVDPEEIKLAELSVTSAAESLELARLGKQTAQVDANEAIVQAQRRREQAYIALRDAEGSRAEDARVAYAEAEGEEQAARLNAQVTIERAESQYQSAYTAYQRAQANLEALKEGPDLDQIRQQEIQVEQARLRVNQVRRSLQDSEIVAPYSGLVAAVRIDPDTYRSSGQPAFTIVNDSSLYVDVTIDEIDISAVTEGQPVVVVLDAYPDEELSGTVSNIAPSPSEFSGLVAYRVRIELQQSPGIRILDSMTTNVTIATDQIEDVLLLPTWAIRVDQETGESYTYVLDETGVPDRTVVELGRRNESYSEVLSGLGAGARIALVLEERVFTPPGAPSGRSPFN